MKSLELRDGRFHTTERFVWSAVFFYLQKRKGVKKTMKNNQQKETKRDLDLNQRKEELRRLLVTNERCTLQYLADSLQVSKRTIKRYLDEIERDTMLIFHPGRYGGVSLADRSQVKRLYLKEYELEVLHRIISDTETTGQCHLKFADLKILKDMVSFYSK
jgi:transcriptional antiterminator